MQRHVMELWCQKGSVSGDLVYVPDSLGRHSKLLEVNGQDKLISEKGSDSIIEEVKYSTLSGNPFLTNFAWDVRFNKGSTGEQIAPTMSSPNLFLADDGFSSKLPSPFSDSNCQESTPIDLKLGRLADYGGSKTFKLFPGSSMVFSAESSTPIKRTRSAGLNSQTFSCQVHGCNKDLSSSKDYHKRHRVCDTHSKTAKVIVKGIEQRFCQQCSRFHLLAEFDEGKRSCRRRLAGHNERRRKPHIGKHCGRSGRFQSCHGGAFNGISFTKTSSVCENMVPTNQLQLEKLGENGWNQHIKLEFESNYNNLFGFLPANGNLLPKSSLPDVNLGKQYPCLYEGQANHLLKSVTTRSTGDDYSHGMPGLPCSDLSYSVTSGGNQDSKVFCTEPAFNDFSTTMSPGALSLLSSQSQNSPNYSTGIPMTQASSITGNPANCSGIPVSDTLLRAIPVASVNGMSHKHASCGLRSEISNLCPILIPDDRVGVHFEDSELFHGLTADTDRLSCEDELTIDLLQLSSQLQRVERQKQFVYATSHTTMNTTTRQ